MQVVHPAKDGLSNPWCHGASAVSSASVCSCGIQVLNLTNTESVIKIAVNVFMVNQPFD